jgi:Arc/MetJ-type ribon-helix-helix transcriptional regulator
MMAICVEIPADLESAIEAEVAKGGYANEQELVNEILRAAVPVLEHYRQLRRDVQSSLLELRQGSLRDADFDAVRQRLLDEFDESGQRE